MLFRTYLAGVCLLLIVFLFTVEGRGILLLGGGTILLLIASFFPYCSLAIRVDTEVVQARYCGGIAGRRVPIEDILKAEIVRFPWHTEWWYGILWIWWQDEIIVGGPDAVVLTLPQGRSVTLGTDEPEALHRAILEAMNSFA